MQNGFCRVVPDLFCLIPILTDTFHIRKRSSTVVDEARQPDRRRSRPQSHRFVCGECDKCDGIDRVLSNNPFRGFHGFGRFAIQDCGEVVRVHGGCRLIRRIDRTLYHTVGSAQAQICDFGDRTTEQCETSGHPVETVVLHRCNHRMRSSKSRKAVKVEPGFYLFEGMDNLTPTGKNGLRPAYWTGSAWAVLGWDSSVTNA